MSLTRGHMSKGLSVVLTVVVGALGLGCGGDDGPPASGQGRSLCAGETRADTFVAGMQKPTRDATFSVRLADTEVEGIRAPPDRGNNAWVIELLDNRGSTVEGATLTLRPWMPDHGHGTTPLEFSPSETAGMYVFGPFDLFMSGFWEFTVGVNANGSQDRAVFGFCLEG